MRRTCLLLVVSAAVVPAVGYGRCGTSSPAGGGGHVRVSLLPKLTVVLVIAPLPLLLVCLPERRWGRPRCHGVEIAAPSARSCHVAILLAGVPRRHRCRLRSCT